MKPIQEYTKQEKLAAISEYNPCRTERNAVLRYLLAVRRDNAEEVAYFEGFGRDVHHIIRQVVAVEALDAVAVRQGGLHQMAESPCHVVIRSDRKSVV